MSNQQELLLSAVWESSADAMRITDFKGKVLNVNDAYCALTGFDKKSVIGKSFVIVYDKKEQTGLMNYYLEFLESDKLTERSHKKITFYDGRRHSIEASYSQIVILEEKFVLAIIRDITDSMNIMEAHRAGEEKFRSLLEESPNMVFINKAGRILYVNNKCIEILGYTRDEFLAPEFNFLDIISPEYVELVKENFANRGKGLAKDFYEYALLTKDRKRIETTITAKIINYEGTDAMLGIVTDITERKQKEKEIKIKNEELLKLNAEKDKFFSIIAHDLRSPFTGFLGYTDLLKTDLHTMTLKELQGIATTMNRNAHKLFGLLTNLLEWSMMQRGLTIFNPERISIKNLAEENIKLYLETAKYKGIEIKEEIDDNAFVFADKSMLNTVLNNLISNAIKFTNKEGRVTISSDIFDNNAVITVKDTGIGMSDDMINDLFKIDKKTNRTGTENEPSTGLGLYLCKEFVVKHKGKIWIVSEEGVGSEFFVSLPLE